MQLNRGLAPRLGLPDPVTTATDPARLRACRRRGRWSREAGPISCPAGCPVLSISGTRATFRDRFLPDMIVLDAGLPAGGLGGGGGAELAGAVGADRVHPDHLGRPWPAAPTRRRSTPARAGGPIGGRPGTARRGRGAARAAGAGGPDRPGPVGSAGHGWRPARRRAGSPPAVRDDDLDRLTPAKVPPTT
jgi:hypothetical protein